MEKIGQMMKQQMPNPPVVQNHLSGFERKTRKWILGWLQRLESVWVVEEVRREVPVAKPMPEVEEQASAWKEARVVFLHSGCLG